MKKIIIVLGLYLILITLPSSRSALSVNPLLDDTVSVLAIKKIRGDLWLCTSNGAYKVQGDTLQRIPDQDLTVWDIIETGGDLWLISTNGAYRVRNGQGRRIPDDNLHVFYIKDVDGKLFLQTDNGLYQLSGDTLSKLNDEKYSVDVVKAEGITWIKSLALFYAMDSLQFSRAWARKNRISELVQLKQSTWLFGYKGAFEISRGKIIRHILRKEKIRTIADTPRGIFIGTQSGAFLLEGNKINKVISEDNENSIYTITASGYSVWLLSSDHAYCIDSKGIHRIDNLDIGRSQITIDGSIYVYGEYENLYRIHGSDIKLLTEEKSIETVKQIGSDIWAFNYDGAYRFRGEDYDTYLEDIPVTDVIPDGPDVWLASREGAYKLSGDTIQRIPDGKISIKDIVVSNKTIWISSENGDCFRVKENKAERITSPLTDDEAAPSLGNGLLKLEAKISNFKPLEDDNYSIRFIFDLDLQFINKSNRPALIWDKKTSEENSLFWIGGSFVAFTKEDALARHYASSTQRWPSYSGHSDWRNQSCILDKPQPPQELIRILRPGETWSLTHLKDFIDFEKKSMSFPPNEKMWDEIKDHKPLWIQIELEAWPIDLGYRQDDSFGFMLRRRWQPYGILQLGRLTSAPIRLDLPLNP
jgi:hypothetical protein